MKKRYKILSIILALAIVLGSIVTISIFSSSAESFTDENGIKWTVTENYPGWAIKPNDISEITGDITIPATYNGKVITTIPDSAFSQCQNVTSVIIPDSVAIIGKNAFSNCPNLTSVTIGDGAQQILERAFEMCTSLTNLDLGNSVKHIGPRAFANCSALTSLVAPDSITIIDDYAFTNTSLSTLSLGNSVETIGEYAFSYCTNLTSLTIPDSVTYIDNGAFRECSNLANLALGNNVETISWHAFYNCKGLTKLEIPNSVKYLSGFACCTGLTSIEIPDSVETIGVNAFSECTGLTSIVIPDGVTKIEDSAFRWCSKLSGEVVIPNSVTYIGDGAFEYCNNITNFIVPENVITTTTSFSSKASEHNAKTETFTDENGISWTVTESYPGWMIKPTDKSSLNGDISIPSVYNQKPIVKIESIAFRDNANITSITIPNTVVEISNNAFTKCTGLTSVSIPDSVTYIGKSAFEDCTNLSTLSLGNSVETIGEYAFNNCTGLTSITIPDSVINIEQYAFRRCSNIETLSLGNSVETIGYNAFTECKKITSLEIPNSVKYLSGFWGCKLSGELIIPDGITEIGEHAFDNCTGLTSIVIPDSVTTIDDYAFNGCKTAFDSIVLGENITYVGHYAFANLGELDTLTIENKKTSDVLLSAFYADTFKNLVVADTVEKIDTPLLSGNKNFASVGLGSNLTISNPYAFYGNSNMTITTPEGSDSVISYANANNIPITITSAVEMDKPVDFEVTCDKSGYEFTVYRVADLESGVNPYEIRYNSLIAEIEDEIFEGDSVAMLEELDKIDSSVFTEVVGTYNTDVDGSSKMFENLPAGIYYVRATNFPANVYSVQNSVFALPYYVEESNWWTYKLSPIPLATKVDESNPEIVKTITNSTKDNVNFTDVSLGDTVNFEIEASRVGSANVVESKNFKLNSYVVSDIMESGLTLNQDSFVVTLEDIDGNTLTTLENTTDYVVNIVANEGADTTFTVSLTPEYLAQDEFYSSANVVIAYSAVLNKYATREFDGNYNTATDLTYSNKTNVTSTVEGNTVYAYTFGIEVNKYDDAGTPLAGSEFGLYLTEDDAKVMKNAIATGTSTDTGKVEFFTESNDVIRLASGTYYIVETKSTENYNRYTDVIPVTITAEYSETETNGTYILSAPANGIQLVEVKNSKVVIPNTGGDGAMYRYLIALAFAMLAVTLVVIKKRNTKKATVTK